MIVVKGYNMIDPGLEERWWRWYASTEYGQHNARLPRVTHTAAWEDHFVNQIQPIAQTYNRMPPYDPNAVGAWQELAQDSARRANEIRNRYDVQVTDDPEPYPHAQAMFNDLNRGRFVVSRANSEHPIWTPEQNVDFRTVHDVLGHYPSGGDFGWQGENLACGKHFGLLAPNAQRALMTECLGQTGAAIHNGGFGQQKVGFMDPLLAPAQQTYNRTASMPEGGFCHRHIRHGLYKLPEKTSMKTSMNDRYFIDHPQLGPGMAEATEQMGPVGPLWVFIPDNGGRSEYLHHYTEPADIERWAQVRKARLPRNDW